jgi:hypothetical protein
VKKAGNSPRAIVLIPLSTKPTKETPHELVPISNQSNANHRTALPPVQPLCRTPRLRHQCKGSSCSPLLPNSWRQPIKRATRLEALTRIRYSFCAPNGTAFRRAKSQIQTWRRSDDHHPCPALTAPHEHSPAGYAGSLWTAQSERCDCLATLHLLNFALVQGEQLVANLPAHRLNFARQQIAYRRLWQANRSTNFSLSFTRVKQVLNEFFEFHANDFIERTIFMQPT